MELLLVRAAPDAEDVTAGGIGAVILLGLFGGVIFLMFNFRKQIRKTQAAADAGVFGDEPAEADGPTDEAAPADETAPADQADEQG